MGLSVCGFNHVTATVAQREIFQLGRVELSQAVRDYKELCGCQEVVIIATCNRVEFYRYDQNKADQLEEVGEFFRRRGLRDITKLRDICYCHQKTTVARHLFRVAAGLDSLVLGEDQVFHQIKEAYSSACAVGGPGTILHKLFHLAFQVGKRVRTETNLGSGPRSIPGAALELLRERMKGRQPESVLVCGVNEMTETILEGLARWGVPSLVANRTLDKARKLAAIFNAKPLPLNEVGKIIPGVDAVICATSSSCPVIRNEHFENFTERTKPLFLIDLAVPRDIAPELAELPGIVLFDLQDMKRYLERLHDNRILDIPLAEKIIEEQVHAYSLWRASEKQRAKILKTHRELNRMRKAELERFKEGFRPSEYRALDAFSQALVRNFMRILPEVLAEESRTEKSAV